MINEAALGGYDPEMIPQRVLNDDSGMLVPTSDQPMDEEDFRYRVRQAIEDCATYIDSYIAPDRETAMNYYLGNLFGNEEAGRSQVVMTEVRDTVLAMMPSLLRIFVGGTKTLEFVPKSAEDV